jgi:integrase
LASRDLFQRDAGEVVDTPPGPVAASAAEAEPVAASAPKRMADAFAAWQGLGVRKDKTVRVFRKHVAVFAEMMGDPDLAALKRADGIRFRDALTRRAIKDTNTAASADNVLTTIKAITNVAVDQGWLSGNPFERLAVTEGGRKSEGREPWTPEELPRLFDAPLFTAYALPSGNAIATKAGADAAYWVPLLCLYTGARPSEVCQLWTDDLSVVGGHLIVEFREDLDRGTSLKNPASWRALPIHTELIRLGFRDYWEQVSASANGAGWLFPAVPKSGANGAAGQFGQWFGEFKAAQGFNSPKKSLHSFRHTVETELGFAELSGTLVDAITGHEGKGTGRKTYAATIRRQAVRLRPSLERLVYPGLRLPRVFGCAK